MEVENEAPGDDYSSNLLVNIHSGLEAPGPGESIIVSGEYEYWHYGCDGFNDQGWGCGYRTLQTMASWLKSIIPDPKPQVPSIPEIQKLLVDMGDKEPSFFGSNYWIGSFEICLVLDRLYDVRCKIIYVDKGKNLDTYKPIIKNHFLKSRCPIMMGGDRDSSSKAIVGIHEGPENTYLLIVDPHFIGRAECHYHLQQNYWVKWQDLHDFIDSSFYNLCMPQAELKLYGPFE